MLQQQHMYHDDEEPSFQQPEHAPYERNKAFKKSRKAGIYKPPFFFYNATSLIIALIGVIFFFISFGGTAWYEVPEGRSLIPKTFGLWRLCIRSECVVDMTNDYMIKRYLIATSETNSNDGLIAAFEHYLMPVKVLMCVAVLFTFVMMSANLAFIAGFPTFFIEAVGQMFVGFLVSVAVGIFGGNFRDDKHQAPFGWSYWCGVVAAMILIVNGALMMVISLMVYRKRGGFRRKK